MGNEDNGKRPSLAPEAVAALAEHTAAKVSADERWIQQVSDDVALVAGHIKAFEAGETPWQRDVTATLAKISNQVIALTVARIVWPSLAVLVALGMGGAIADILWRVLPK
jgi:hypothetical protein